MKTLLSYFRGMFLYPPLEAREQIVPRDARLISETVVGKTVRRFSTIFDAMSEREKVLSAEIERMTEELRQIRLAKETTAAALVALGDDKALTHDEREMAALPFHVAVSTDIARLEAVAA